MHRVRQAAGVPASGVPTQAPQGHDRVWPGGVPVRAAGVHGLWAALRPAAELLGLRPHQRRTERLSELAASLAVEVAYAKASRLLAELAGPAVSARTIRRDVIAMAPERVGPEILDVPIGLLDGTGERAGTAKGGAALHLAIGLVARRRNGRRVAVEARLLGATLGEGWAVMGDLLAGLRPGLILLDGEEELSNLAAERFEDVPVQRCLWHLGRGVYRAAHYSARASHDLADDFRAQLEALLAAAWRDQDHDAALAAYRDLIEDAAACGARAAAAHLRAAETEVFTFLTNPAAGRLLFGDKGRPEVGTGVLERVMREMNRRTDVGVRWSIPRRPSGPHGQAPTQVRSRTVGTGPGAQPTTGAVQPRGLKPVSTLRLATE